MDLFFPILLYLCTFAATIGFMSIAAKLRDSEDPVIRTFGCGVFLMLAVLVPSLIAGLRGDEVGVDVMVYPIPNMQDAVQCSTFEDVFEACGGGWEIAYAGMVYLCSRFTDDVGLLLFVLQFFVALPVCLAALKSRRFVSVSLFMGAYCFVFYNNSLNAMRQSMACGFLLLGFSGLVWGRRMSRGEFLALVLAVILHKSAGLGVLMFLGLLLVSKSFTTPRRMLTCGIVVFAGAMLGLRFLPEISSCLGEINPNFALYEKAFVTGEEGKEWFVNPFSPAELLSSFVVTALVAVPAFFSRGVLKEADSAQRRLFVITAAGWLLYHSVLYSLNTPYGQRISVLLDFFLIAFVACRPLGGLLGALCRWGVLMAYWFCDVVRLNWSDSIHYYFR